MTESNNHTPELNAAFCKAQSEMGPARKGKTNPAFRSTYADLASVIEAIQPLFEHGICFSQITEVTGSVVTVRTVLRHVSGQMLDCGPMTARAKDESAQAIGSVLTYLRRYSLQAACGIASADDDGNAGQHSHHVQTPEARKSEHHPSWADDQGQYFAQLARLGVKKETADLICTNLGRPRPSCMDQISRTRFLGYLNSEAGHAMIDSLDNNTHTEKV